MIGKRMPRPAYACFPQGFVLFWMHLSNPSATCMDLNHRTRSPGLKMDVNCNLPIGQFVAAIAERWANPRESGHLPATIRFIQIRGRRQSKLS